MDYFLYCSALFSFSVDEFGSNSCFSFSLLNAIVKSKGKLIANKIEKKRQLLLSLQGKMGNLIATKIVKIFWALILFSSTDQKRSYIRETNSAAFYDIQWMSFKLLLNFISRFIKKHTFIMLKPPSLLHNSNN